jgi:hypothetical protein
MSLSIGFNWMASSCLCSFDPTTVITPDSRDVIRIPTRDTFPAVEILSSSFRKLVNSPKIANRAVKAIETNVSSVEVPI